MLKLIAAVILLFTLTGEPVLNREEALSAYTFLNNVRKDPQVHLDQFPFLKTMKAMPELRWSDTLARVAEAKALDMANRNYFGHVDPDGFGMNYFINKAGYTLDSSWISSPEMNYFESLSAGSSSGPESIIRLIIDANTPSLGHRNHLLGLTEWHEALTDIGIGYAVGGEKSNYVSYTCVIIARHSW